MSNAGRRARTPTLMPGRSLTRPCPGTGTPPSQFVSGLSACLSLQRARFHPPPRSNVAVAVHPLLRSNAFMRAVGVTTSPLTRLVLELALRARTRHRVCRLLFELRPRLAQSSAGQSDRPAAADDRVCFDGRPRPASVRSLSLTLRVPSAPRTIAGLVRRGSLTPARTGTSTPLSRTLRRLRDRFAAFPARLSRETGKAPLREHGSAPASLRSQRFEAARVPGHTRRRARPPRPRQSGGRLRINCSGDDARSCASVPPLIASQTAAADEPDSGVSIRFTPLRFAATPDLDGNEDTRPRVCRFRSAPFHGLKPPETGRRTVTLATLARFACCVEANREGRDRAESASLRSADGMKERLR